MLKLSFIIPSAPDRDFSPILENIKRLHSPKYAFEIFIIKGTWPSAQRNLGIKQATGDIIFFLDDDIIVPECALESALKHFEDPKIAAVGGPNLTPEKNSFLQHCFGAVMGSAFTFGPANLRYRQKGKPRSVDENGLISCNLALRASATKKHLYDEKMFHNEENEWLGRIKRNEGKLLYEPEFLVYHHRRNSLKKFFRQILNWGHGRGEHMVIQPKHFKPAFLVPTFFIWYLISLFFFHPFWYLSPLFAYSILNIIFSLQLAIENRNPLIFFMAVWLMPAIHILYGTGMMIGIVRRLIKPRRVPHYDPEKFEIHKTDL